MRVFGLVLGILGVWRVTHLLHAENGPWDLLERLRGLSEGALWRGLFGCFYCLSLWVALPFSLLLAAGSKERLLLWPALSGGAILLERVTSREVQAAYFEEPPAETGNTEENDDVFMRKDERASAIDREGERTRRIG